MHSVALGTALFAQRGKPESRQVARHVKVPGRLRGHGPRLLGVEMRPCITRKWSSGVWMWV